jgi:hypothetical protein
MSFGNLAFGILGFDKKSQYHFSNKFNQKIQGQKAFHVEIKFFSTITKHQKISFQNIQNRKETTSTPPPSFTEAIKLPCKE